MEGTGNGSSGSSGQAGPNGSGNGQPSSKGGKQQATSTGSSGNNHHGPMGPHDMFKPGKNPHSDGEDDDIDDIDDDDQSPDLRSLGSTSEQSLTSPAEVSSLNSIGSPASIASPSTPVSQTLESSGDFRLGFGAFKPPNMPASTATSTTPAGYQPGSLGSIPGSSQPHHHPHIHQMFQHHRPPVGTDPRDSKNPLSILQLTGNSGNFHHHSQSHHLPLNHVSQHPGGPGSIPGGHPAPDKRALPLMT